MAEDSSGRAFPEIKEIHLHERKPGWDHPTLVTTFAEGVDRCCRDHVPGGGTAYMMHELNPFKYPKIF